MGFIPSKDHRMSFGEICKLQSLDSIHWLRKCHTDKYLLLLLLSTYFNAYLKKWFHIKPWDSKSLFAKFKKWVRFKNKMNSLPTPDFYSLSALPPSQPWTCLGSAVGSDLPKRIWFPSLWLSKRGDFCDGSLPFLKENSEKPISPHSQKMIINYAPWNATGNHPGTVRTNQFEDEASPDNDVGETRRCWPSRATRSHRRGTSLVVQLLTLCTSTAQGVGSIPGWGTKTPHVTGHGQKIKQNKMCF